VHHRQISRLANVVLHSVDFRGEYRVRHALGSERGRLLRLMKVAILPPGTGPVAFELTRFAPVRRPEKAPVQFPDTLAGNAIKVPPMAEDLCLRYANTLCWRGCPAPSEALGGFDPLLGWLGEARVLPAELIGELSTWGRAHPTKAAQVFAAAITLRETLYRAFSALAVAGSVPDEDFHAFQHALSQAPERRQVVRAGGHFAWRIGALRPRAPDLLAPVLWSAADLLLASSHRRIGRCANPQCLWLFVDASKGATRQWCDMSSCGNRSKARRHYAKAKAGA
jgi:predicted RNA-binding Zn ribbon-like protein